MASSAGSRKTPDAQVQPFFSPEFLRGHRPEPVQAVQRVDLHPREPRTGCNRLLGAVAGQSFRKASTEGQLSEMKTLLINTTC
jgi:hypothetical protein